MTGKNNKLDAAERTRIREMLLRRREAILKNVTRLEDDTLKSSRKEAAGDLSSVPYHMADLASDNYEQEFALGLIENEGEELREIDAALKRLHDGVFGICDVCKKPISKKRLMAIPYAQLCVECKNQEEQKTGPAGY
jgi:RNA polymerase-binding protein DksA